MRFLLCFIAGILFTLTFFEIGLRFIPVNSGLRMEATSDTAPYSRYLPNQEFTYSHGWSLLNTRQAVTNKNGFINSANFDENPAKVLVIGDSFIESPMLNYNETLQGQLESKLGKGVYAVAASGNGLADSLELLKKFTPIITPRVIVIFVKPHELENMTITPSRGHSGFKVQDMDTKLFHNPYQESPVKLLVLRSALARYFYYNLNFNKLLATTLNFGESTDTHIVSASQGEMRQMIDYYLIQLNSYKKANTQDIILLVDGDRSALYAGSKSNGSSNSIYFANKAIASGFIVVDMQPVFEKHWLKHKERFDYLPADGHWNPVSHKLAAEAVLPYLHQSIGSQ